MKKLLVILLALGVSACATTPPSQLQTLPAKAAAGRTGAVKLVTGQTATAAPGDFAGYGRAWRLTSTVDGSTGTVTDELEVTLLYIQPSWAFFNAATDSDAAPLTVLPIALQANGCSDGACAFHETVGVMLPSNKLIDGAKSGFRVKIAAQDGTSIAMDITSKMIRQQLTALAAVRPALVAQSQPN